MADVKETFVWIRGDGSGRYLSIKHVGGRVGWDWKYGSVTRLQDAWLGPLPSGWRQITGSHGYPLRTVEWSRLNIRVTTTTNYELCKEKTDG